MADVGRKYLLQNEDILSDFVNLIDKHDDIYEFLIEPTVKKVNEEINIKFPRATYGDMREADCLLYNAL